MSSQKQSRRIRQLEKLREDKDIQQQRTINGLIEQNQRLSKKLEHYETKPAWWKLFQRSEWRKINDAIN